jgi:PAS domain S-box-containing protein
VDSNARFIARLPARANTFAGELASEGWQQAMRRSPEGVADHLSKEGLKIVDAYVRTRFGWTAGVAITKDALEAPYRQTRASLISAGIGCLMLGLLFAWVTARRLISGTAQLNQAAAAIAAGKPIHPSRTSVRELDMALGSLARASELLAYNIREREGTAQQLRESEQQLQTIVNATPFMLTRCSRDLRYRYVSRSYANLLGLQREDIAGQAIVDVIGDEGFSTVLPHIQKVLRGELVEYESVVHFKGVGNRALHVIYVPERDERGEIEGWIASIDDVTERRKVEAQRNVLIDEVNHRVRNTLAKVTAIARQTFKQHEDLPEFHTFMNRIQALARTHNRLSATKWDPVPLRSIVSDEIGPYELNSNVRISGPDISLRHNQAVSLGMALHELAANSAKHGSLSVKGGQLAVTWEVDPREGHLHLQWNESGGPEILEPERGGFGRLFLERALPSELEGTVQLHFRKDGLYCNIHFPLETSSSSSIERRPEDRNIN